MALGVNRLSSSSETSFEGKILPLEQRPEIKIIKIWKKKIVSEDENFIDKFTIQRKRNIIFEKKLE